MIELPSKKYVKVFFDLDKSMKENGPRSPGITWNEDGSPLSVLALPISRELIKNLEKWAKAYRAMRDYKGSKSSYSDYSYYSYNAIFQDWGRELAKDMKKELNGWRVVWRNESDKENGIIEHELE